jgi:glycerophosphoryl diester phosphodiesterase
MRLLKILIFFIIFNQSFAEYSNKFVSAGEPEFSRNKVIEVYGHRGARSFAPENSILAYKTALQIGVNWVDMDVVVTKDGEVIVYHDLWINPDFTSLNGKFFAISNKDFIASIGDKKDQIIQKYLLKNITFDELQKYSIGVLNSNSIYSKFFPDQYLVKDVRIPKLQNVIDYVDDITDKNVMYQIEIKNDPTNPQYTVDSKIFAQKIYDILKKNNLIERAEIQAFDWNVLYELQLLDKDVKTAYLIGYDEIDYARPERFKYNGKWSGGKILKDYNNSLPRMVKMLGGCCYEPEDVLLTKEDLDSAHNLGLKVVVWTWPEHSGRAFDPALINKLINWGVDGIITDDPAKLNSMLAVRGYKTPMNYHL